MPRGFESSEYCKRLSLGRSRYEQLQQWLFDSYHCYPNSCDERIIWSCALLVRNADAEKDADDAEFTWTDLELLQSLQSSLGPREGERVFSDLIVRRMREAVVAALRGCEHQVSIAVLVQSLCSSTTTLSIVLSLFIFLFLSSFFFLFTLRCISIVMMK
jgi:hypothetical protein